MSDVLERFARAVDRPDAEIELDTAALLIGSWHRPDLDLEAYRRRLDSLAAAVIAAGDRSAVGVAQTLFRDLGFAGNAADYYDPENSFLSSVLDRRLGIPITLAVVFLETARRVGVVAHGVSFPGHFLVSAETAAGAVIVDPFGGGGLVSVADLEARLRTTVGPAARLESSHTAAAGHREILSRILRNLSGIYGKRGDYFASLEVLERMYLLDRENSKLKSELETLRRQVGDLN